MRHLLSPQGRTSGRLCVVELIYVSIRNQQQEMKLTSASSSRLEFLSPWLVAGSEMAGGWRSLGVKSKKESVSHPVVSDALWPCGPWPTKILCPWKSPGKNTGVLVYDSTTSFKEFQSLDTIYTKAECIIKLWFYVNRKITLVNHPNKWSTHLQWRPKLSASAGLVV